MNKYIIYLLLLVSIISCKNITIDENGVELQSKNIIETGELVAVETKSFILPRFGRQWYEMKIIGILEHGAIIKEGDSIIQLDPTPIQNFIVTKESGLETEIATFEKMKVNHENTLNEIDSKIKNELASFELKKIELEASRFETERKRKIAELEFKQAEIQLAKEKKKMEFNKVMIKNDTKIQQIKVDQLKKDIKDSYELLPKLTIRSDISGIFQIMVNWNTDNLIKVGDNFYAGNNMANVPDLRWMKVKTFVDENDFLRLKKGQKVSVKLDAMPKVIFDGEISYIGKLCRKKDNKSKQKVFDIEVKMLKSDERLKPGMTVSCEFL